jgi:hypothetical protein
MALSNTALAMPAVAADNIVWFSPRYSNCGHSEEGLHLVLHEEPTITSFAPFPRACRVNGLAVSNVRPKTNPPHGRVQKGSLPPIDISQQSIGGMPVSGHPGFRTAERCIRTGLSVAKPSTVNFGGLRQSYPPSPTISEEVAPCYPRRTKCPARYSFVCDVER